MNINKVRGQFILIITFLLVFLISYIIPGNFEKGSLYISNLFYRIRYHIVGKDTVSPSLYVLTIDDNDIEELKIGSKNREIFAGILDILKNTRVKTVVFDIVFKEKSLEKEDQLLVNNTREAGNVFYPVILKQSGTGNMPLNNKKRAIIKENSIFPRTEGKGPQFSNADCIAPFYNLAMASKGVGDISVMPDSDGIVHQITLLQAYREGYFPSLVLRGICDFFEVDPGDLRIVFGKYIVLPGARHPGGNKKNIRIPIDRKGRMLINYSGPWYDSVRLFPVRGLFRMAQEQPRQLEFALEKTFVIVTDISSINQDIYKGIFEPSYPHSGILINAVNTILTSRYPRKPGPYEPIAGALICIIIICLLAVRLKTVQFILAVTVLSLFIIIINLILFFSWNRLPDFMPYLAALFTSLTALMIYKLVLFVQHEKKVVRENWEAREMLLKKENEIVSLHKDGLQKRKSLEERFSEYGVSKRQKEVLVLLKLGKERKEIASELKISVHTVNDHFKCIFEKCNVSSSLELLQIFKG